VKPGYEPHPKSVLIFPGFQLAQYCPLFTCCPQKVIDFQWCPDDPWLMMSVSESLNPGGSEEEEEDEDEEEGDGNHYAPPGGGTLQIWRITDMLYMPEQEAMAELEAHR
jgi:hypothetical protein